MESERFDQFARTLGAACSRRDHLKALFGSAHVSVAGVLGVDKASAGGRRRSPPGGLPRGASWGRGRRSRRHQERRRPVRRGARLVSSDGQSRGHRTVSRGIGKVRRDARTHLIRDPPPRELRRVVQRDRGCPAARARSRDRCQFPQTEVVSSGVPQCVGGRAGR